jgi:hypothetical protein
MRAALLLAIVLQSAAACSCFKVFGLSPGRSGTDSQKVKCPARLCFSHLSAVSDICSAFQIAFTRLGFGPAMHMMKLLFEESGIPTFHHFRMYEAAVKGEKIDWREMLEAFNSGTDQPISSFPEELLHAFPDARFISTRGTSRFKRRSASSLLRRRGP